MLVTQENFPFWSIKDYDSFNHYPTYTTPVIALLNFSSDPFWAEDETPAVSYTTP